MRGLVTRSTELPNEAKMNLYRICGLVVNPRNQPNEPNGGTVDRNLPNEAKVNLYRICGLVTNTRNQPNEANGGTVDRFLPNEANLSKSEGCWASQVTRIPHCTDYSADTL